MGGQLGSSSSSSSCFGDCIAAPQKYCSRKLAVSGRSTLVRRIGRRPNSGVRPNPSLGRGRYVPFSGIKKVLRQKTLSSAKNCSSAKNFFFGKKLFRFFATDKFALGRVGLDPG